MGLTVLCEITLTFSLNDEILCKILSIVENIVKDLNNVVWSNNASFFFDICQSQTYNKSCSFQMDRLTGQREPMVATCLLPDAQATCREPKKFPPRRSDSCDVGREMFDTKAPGNTISNGGDIGVKMQLSRKIYEKLVKQVFESGVVD